MRRCCQGLGLSCLFKGTAASQPPFLLVFDFDETIVDENSDDSVQRGRALPEPLRRGPPEGGSYNEHMRRVLAALGEQGVRPAELRAVYESLPLCPGMAELFQLLSKHRHLLELVLISDANTFGVEAKLRAAGVRSLFRKVFSNPASLDGRGVLRLGPFHSHRCPRCPPNLCKAKVLQGYLAERPRFQRVFYVGDGANDFCPAGTLREADVAFPRKGYPMHRLIQESQEKQPGAFRAAVVPWESGVEVARYLQEVLRGK